MFLTDQTSGSPLKNTLEDCPMSNSDKLKGCATIFKVEADFYDNEITGKTPSIHPCHDKHPPATFEMFEN